MKNSFKYPVSKILGLYFAWWIFWALVQSFVLHRLGLFWDVAIIDSLITSGLLAFFCFDALIIFNFYQPGKGNEFYRFIFIFGITILFGITEQWVLRHVFLGSSDYQFFLEKSMPVRFIFSLLMMSFVGLWSWMWNNLQEQKDIEKRQNDAEQLAKEAELDKLRQQLQPHFLFNSLNSISALAGSKPNEARKMIQQLSDFLRGTLKKDGVSIVSFKEEIEHLKLYLEIEKVRFGHRLNIEMNFSDDTLSMQLPPLIIQPIVENAIKFGLYDTVDEIIITLSSHFQNGQLIVEVQNPFDAQTQIASRGTGFGLASIKRRLFLTYTRNDLVVTEKKENQFTTTLKIPQIT